MAKRNVAQSPTVSSIIEQGANAARRGLTSTLTKATSGVPESIHSGLQSAVQNLLGANNPNLKWYSEHAPWILGGRAEGGRATYKAGGSVKPKDIEPLVRNLINKAKTAKKISNKATEPLLNAHDDAIASALATAQKAI